jgi:hypothetical protein
MSMTTHPHGVESSNFKCVVLQSIYNGVWKKHIDFEQKKT